MTLTKIFSRGGIKTLLVLAFAFGMLTVASGCDDYLPFGSGFRFGNFNQGHSGSYDCRTNPYAPWC